MPAATPRIAVLYDCVYPWVPGGGQKRLYEIFSRLAARGYQVDWYGLKAWDGEGETSHGGIRFIPVAPQVPLYGSEGKRSIAQTLYYGRAIARFPQLRHYDYIHLGQWPYFHFFPVRAFALFGRARISADWWEVWARHWLSYYGRKGWLGMGLERICARIPSRLVAISETGARELGEIGVRSEHVRVIHNGIDHARISSALPADRRSDLVYLGRLQPHKNVDLLVRALAALNANGRGLTLTIMGDGPERAALEALADTLGQRGQVRFLGAVADDDEVYRHLHAARVFVHPSTKEGGGSITSLEANAAGLPVVAFRHPGGISPELIEQGRNGVWVPEVGHEALSVGIEQALVVADVPGMARERSAAAARYDWSRLADQYEPLFRP